MATPPVERAVIASSVQGWVLPHLIAFVESRDVDAASIRSLFGRTQLEDPNIRVPEALTEKAWALARTLTGDEALGIHLAESLPAARSTSIQYALRSSPSLKKGLDRLARYGRLVSDRVAARTHRKGENLLSLVHDTATTPLHSGRAEFALAVTLMVRDSTGADITPVRACFAHPAPENVAEHRRYFRGRIRFAAGSSSMSLSASDASRPMREAHPALVAIDPPPARERSGGSRSIDAGATSTRVRHLLVERLGQSDLSLEQSPPRWRRAGGR